MNSIGILGAEGSYREIIVGGDETIIPLKPVFRFDGSAGKWVAEIDDPARIGLMNEAGEYREIDYGEDEQIVPVRPGPWHIWEGGKWVEYPAPRDLAAEVSAHALALKIGVVNATRTDGGPAYPVAAEALAAIRDRYTEIVNEVSAKSVVGEEVIAEEKQTVALIRAGFAFFKAVDAAAEAILADDPADVADPIAADKRWPPLPGA